MNPHTSLLGAHCRALSAATILAAATTAAAEQTQPTQTGEVTATATSTPPPTYHPPGYEQRALRPNHPPLDEIPPMPMPEPIEIDHRGPVPPSPLVVHDAQLGSTRLLAPGARSGLPGGSGPGFHGVDGAKSSEDLNFDKGFFDMYQINGTQDFPWRMNVKLVSRFVDEDGNDRWFVCSGSMADAETVLTAGHCVYARTADGPDIFDWAEEIYVYAGWDGVGNQFDHPDDIINPYGFARGTYYLTSNAWINDGNFDYDMGLIRVTRGVGMMTGWFGWAWGFGCDTIQDRTYNNASFPFENCHNGRDMYYWYGTFDSCPSDGRQLQLDTGGNCLDTLWGGMSGSAAYYIESDTRYAHAVASNSNRNDIGRYAKMWETFKNDMLDFEDGSRGGDFDLQALRARVAPDTATAGETLTDRSHLAINPTNGTKNANFVYEVYLSTNNNISTADVLLGTQNYDWDFGAMGSVNVNMAGVTIPYDTPSGDYWVGVVYEDATDGNSTNNDSDLWDADPVHVNGVADLEALEAAVDSGTYLQGDPLQIGYEFENIGGDASSGITVNFYASTNDFISDSDTLLGSVNHGGLGGGDSIDTAETFTVPDSLQGDYYIGYIVTASDDVDTANNTAVDSLPITIVVADDCPADLDGDGTVGQSDLGILLQSYGQDDGGDIDGDGDTDQSDLGLLLQDYGTNC